MSTGVPDDDAPDDDNPEAGVPVSKGEVGSSG
jgi:hypothetical protein